MRGKRMTIFTGESDQWHHRPLYMAILEHRKTAGCAGATVTRLIENGSWLLAATNVIGSLLVGMGAVIAGIAAGRAL